MAQNFNVGDKVVDVQNFQYINNVYHHKMTLTHKPQVVTGANEKLFTCVDGVDVDKVSGLSEYSIQRIVYYQNNGQSFAGSTGSVMRTLPAARAYLQKLYDAEIARCDKEDAEEIQKMEAQIRKLQEKIQAVRDGKRPISFKADVVERDFLAQTFKAAMDNLK